MWHVVPAHSGPEPAGAINVFSSLVLGDGLTADYQNHCFVGRYYKALYRNCGPATKKTVVVGDTLRVAEVACNLRPRPFTPTTPPSKPNPNNSISGKT